MWVKKSSHKILPYKTISSAVHGNEDSLNQTLKNFESYTISLSQKIFIDEYGMLHKYVDEEMKRTLENQLIMAILRFKLI